MRESDTFMAIIDEGRAMQARRCLRLLGSPSLGEPDKLILDCLEGVTDIDRLERIHDRVMAASSWEELLDTP